MKPIKITVTGANARVTEKPVITSGTVGLPVEFTFDEAWDGLGKTAVFRAGSRSYPVSCVQSTAIVPWEVLEKGGVGLYIGVFGADEKGTVKIPTVWACADTIAAGTQIPETVPAEPTPNVYDQILTAASKAVETANSVRQDADAGAFIGPPGPKGDAGAIDFIVVAELPAIGDGSKIYLMPELDGEEPNRFGEYVFIEGAWEHIGSAGVEVNLDEYVKNTDFATDGKAGVVIVRQSTHGLTMSADGTLRIYQASVADIDSRTNNYRPITSTRLDYAVKKSLADCKLADTENAWTEEEKTAARELLGAVGDTDFATSTKGGVVKAGTSSFRNKGIYISSEGILAIHQATNTEIEGKANIYFPITPNNLDLAVKTGITTNTIELTEEEKAAACAWLGVSDLIAELTAKIAEMEAMLNSNQ